MLPGDFREGRGDRRVPLRDAVATVCVWRSARCSGNEICTVFTGFNDYWRSFLGGAGPAQSYVASLGADRRAILARKLEETLRPGPDETIILTTRAWTVRGTII